MENGSTHLRQFLMIEEELRKQIQEGAGTMELDCKDCIPLISQLQVSSISFIRVCTQKYWLTWGFLSFLVAVYKSHMCDRFYAWNHLSTRAFVLLFRCSVLSNSLRCHGLQHARLPCPSLSPGVCSNLYPLSQWCYLTILSSVTPFSFCLQSFRMDFFCSTQFP